MNNMSYDEMLTGGPATREWGKTDDTKLVQELFEQIRNLEQALYVLRGQHESLQKSYFTMRELLEKALG